MNNDSNNPFQAPAAAELSATDGLATQLERSRAVFWSVLAAATVLQAVLSIALTRSSNSNGFLPFGDFATPVVSLLFASGYFVRYSGRLRR